MASYRTQTDPSRSADINIGLAAAVLLAVLLAQAVTAATLWADTGDKPLEKAFRRMGIIRMSGIMPPADGPLPDMDGKPVRLSDFKGKIVLLNFWTTWCPDCIREMPEIEALHQKVDRTKLVIIAVDLREPQDKVERFLLKNKLTFKVLLDSKGTLGRAFGIRSIPTTVILNRDGGLMGKAMGARDWGSDISIDLIRYLADHY